MKTDKVVKKFVGCWKK